MSSEFYKEIHDAVWVLLRARDEASLISPADRTDLHLHVLGYSTQSLVSIIAITTPKVEKSLDISEELMMTARVGSASFAHSELMNRAHEEIERLRKEVAAK